MTRHSLLTTVPSAPVTSVIALFALALSLSRHAQLRYGDSAARLGEDAWPVRCVFETLAAREQHRVEQLEAACLQACGRLPAPADVPWCVPDLVPDQEVIEVQHSELATAYTAWAMAVQHRRRAFVFWSYVIAVATDRAVQAAAEAFAHEALSDGNRLRHERRLAWRAQHDITRKESAERSEPESAALLESLLQRDVTLWSQLAPDDRAVLESAGVRVAAPVAGEAQPETAPLDDVKRRALRRAELLSTLYLDDADRALDQPSLDFAQKLAAESIARLASLRQAAEAVSRR
ncbi:hypothetical protein [Rhodopseudomonas telluris]|uniref:Secreted protein n=1 Tax=Rhodopseudomonas telluris TaxID=644215 RepID=A0ABV6EVZ1_9BRAD